MTINPLTKKLEMRDSLSEAEKRALEGAIARIKDYAPREDLVRDGQEPGHSTLLLEGFACRYKVLNDGRRQITAFHVSGDFVDLHSFVLKKMDHSVAAITPCRAALVPHDELREITEKYPHLARLLWFSTLIDAAIHREWIIGMGRRSAHGQLAHLICELYLRLRAVGLAKENSIPLPMTQQELGDALGFSVVHTNRVLHKLRDMGLIRMVNKTLAIDNWDGLRKVAEFDPTYLHLEAAPR